MNNFKLSDTFVEKYKNKKPPFGFNGLGDLVYQRTYSRIKEDGKNEKWFETVERVVNGTYNMQKYVIEKHGLGWNAWQAQRSAQEMYDRIFNMKFLPPGRGLWAMGSPLTEKKKLFASLNNCSFVSTESLKDDPAKPFCFLMDMSMLGVGVGFDTQGAGTITVKGPNQKRKEELFDIPDTREGWVESIKLLLESYFHGTQPVSYNYDNIRPAGKLIKGFGGVTSGPEPLKQLHIGIKNLLDKEIGAPISITSIVDIMNMIGKAVVSGNVRRCLPPWYEVLTVDGFKKMEELTVGDKVVTNSGEKVIKNTFNSGKQKVLKINTMNNTTYEATEKHTLLVYNKDDGFVWKMVKDIDPEFDYLVQPKK